VSPPSPAHPPSFPSVPPEFWEGTTEPTAERQFLEDVRQWRTAMIGWLELGEAVHQMPPKLVECLLWILRADVPSQLFLELDVYSVHPFPHDLIASGESVDQAAIMSILVWRAAAVDFFSDVWDVIGEPVFTLQETRLAKEPFMPANYAFELACPICLRPRPTPGDIETPMCVDCPILQSLGALGGLEPGNLGSRLDL